MPTPVLAKLRFQKVTSAVTGAGDWGEVVLYKNGTVRLYAGDGLRGRLLRTAERVDKAALLYGATAFMGFAAAGAGLVVKRKTGWGYIMLALAALTALFGSGVRAATKNAPRLFDTLFDRGDVTADVSPEGGLTVTLADKPWKGTALRFEAGEFDPAQAAAFVAALRRRG